MCFSSGNLSIRSLLRSLPAFSVAGEEKTFYLFIICRTSRKVDNAIDRRGFMRQLVAKCHALGLRLSRGYHC